MKEKNTFFFKDKVIDLSEMSSPIRTESELTVVGFSFSVKVFNYHKWLSKSRIHLFTYQMKHYGWKDLFSLYLIPNLTEKSYNLVSIPSNRYKDKHTIFSFSKYPRSMNPRYRKISSIRTEADHLETLFPSDKDIYVGRISNLQIENSLDLESADEYKGEVEYILSSIHPIINVVDYKMTKKRLEIGKNPYTEDRRFYPTVELSVFDPVYI